MEIKGNTYYFTIAEKNKIKKLIDKKYGKISTPIDYETTGGDYDIGLEAEIFNISSERISGSTLERLVGLRKKENRGVRKTTIDTIIKYLDFQDSEQFLKYIEYSSSHQDTKEEILDFNSVFKNHLIKIEFGNNKVLITRYLNLNKFEVLHTSNSKILKRDIIELSNLEVGEELVCSKVLRIENKKSVMLGKYKSGENNKVLNITFSKKL